MRKQNNTRSGRRGTLTWKGAARWLNQKIELRPQNVLRFSEKHKQTERRETEGEEEKKEMNWAKPKMYLFLGIRHTLNRSRGKLVFEFIMHVSRDNRLFVFNLITISNIWKAFHNERIGLTNTTNHINNICVSDAGLH